MIKFIEDNEVLGELTEKQITILDAIETLMRISNTEIGMEIIRRYLDDIKNEKKF